MPGKSAFMENGVLQLIFNGASIPGVADNAVANTLSSLYVSLHTADPSDGGNQSSSEVVYSDYARVGVSRDSNGWVVTANTVSPSSVITFPSCSNGTSNAAYFAIGSANTGPGTIFYSGPLNPVISISAGVTPRISANSKISEG